MTNIWNNNATWDGWKLNWIKCIWCESIWKPTCRVQKPPTNKIVLVGKTCHVWNCSGSNKKRKFILMNLFQSFSNEISICFLGVKEQSVYCSYGLYYHIIHLAICGWSLYQTQSTTESIIYKSYSQRFIATVTLYKHSNADTKLISTNEHMNEETGRLWFDSRWFSVKFSSY